MKTNRIESIDLLRGLVMILMALDHCRDYFHLGGLTYDPSDLTVTTPILFFTRFITHFCAPVFVFLAGTSAYLYGRKKTKSTLAKFLFTRGLWLIFIEVTVNNFIWWFDLNFGFFNLQVLWAIGWSMIALSVLIRLPMSWLLGVSLLIVAGHNLMDGIVMEGYSLKAIAWYFLHQVGFVPLSEELFISFSYPILPWIGVMALGYCFGTLYQKDYDVAKRKKYLWRMGWGAIALFFVLRTINVYGNLTPWAVQQNEIFTVMSFINVTKYPPSLDFVLLTLGPAMLFLYFSEQIKNKLTSFVLVFGHVPFFYYLFHMLVIHLGAILGLVITGGDWEVMILTNETFVNMEEIKAYGYSLGVVYLVWIAVVLFTYPFCRRYMLYKMNNKDKKWLSYL